MTSLFFPLCDVSLPAAAGGSSVGRSAATRCHLTASIPSVDTGSQNVTLNYLLEECFREKLCTAHPSSTPC